MSLFSQTIYGSVLCLKILPVFPLTKLWAGHTRSPLHGIHPRVLPLLADPAPWRWASSSCPKFLFNFSLSLSFFFFLQIVCHEYPCLHLFCSCVRVSEMPRRGNAESHAVLSPTSLDTAKDSADYLDRLAFQPRGPENPSCPVLQPVMEFPPTSLLGRLLLLSIFIF